MRVITTPETTFLARELGEFAGFYIDRFYEVAEGRFRIKLSRRGAQQANLQIILSHTVNKTIYIEKQEHATNFALAARKRIEGFMIDDISQYNDDRILVFRLHKGEESANMIIEMFGKGNLIIADKEMRITLAYTIVAFSDRRIRPGETYIPPKKSFAKEKEQGKEAEIEGKPTLYMKDGKAVDYSIGNQEKGLESKEFGTIQEVLDILYYENPVTAKKGKTAKEKLVEELLSSIEKQEKSSRNLDGEIERNKEAGKLLLERMGEVNESIGAMKSNKKLTKEELQRMFPKLKVLNVDLQEKTVTIDI